MPPRILVVDDSKTVRKVLRAILEDSYDVWEAASGAEAVQALSEEPVDLVLLDLVLPDIDGFALCEAIKQRATSQFLPVIMLTGLDHRADRHRGLRAGADDYMIKPPDPDELLMRVQAFLRIREQEKEALDRLTELERLQTVKDELAGLILHDLRNPLSSLLGILSLIAGTTKDPETQRDVEVALDAGRHLKELVDDLLTVRLLEDGRVPFRALEQPLAPVVAQSLRTVDGLARERQSRIALHVDDDLPVAIDRKLVQRAVENLLVNALSYSPSRSEIQVDIGAGRVRIADTGPGIPEALKATLFQKYGSAEFKGGRRGFGLGLYLVSLVAQAHCGEVLASDNPQGGAIFELRLQAAS